MIDARTIENAVQVLLDASPAGTRVILFGSHARGSARADSDLDLLVVQPTLADRSAEAGRLRSLLRPLGVAADVMVVSRAGFDAWKDIPNNVVHEAWTSGVIYGTDAHASSGVHRQGA